MSAWLSALTSAIHLAALGVGAALLWLRADALRRPLDGQGVARVLRIDAAYGLALFGLTGSGLVRLFGDGDALALHAASPLFRAKMALVAAGWACELAPTLLFARWRTRRARGLDVDTTRARALRRLHLLGLPLLLAAAPVAVLTARGVGGSSAGAPPPDAIGEDIYRTRCAPCHQPDGRGLDGKLAADFVGDPTRLGKPDAVLLASIAGGVPGTAMRGFAAELDERQRRAVLAYLRRRFGRAARP